VNRLPWKLDRDQVDATLEELGVASTPESRQLITVLATDPHALYTSLSRLSEIELDERSVPDVDGLVERHLQSSFSSCTEPSVLHKGKPISKQCTRLLAILLRDLGQPVPLPELLLVNGLRSGTPRRLRELELEHGAFSMRTYSRDRVQHYILDSPAPDVAVCAAYWVRANLRDSELAASRRVLALLSAFVGKAVSYRDVDYVLPEQSSPGPGLPRASSGDRETAVAELVVRGYSISEGPEGLCLTRLS
jgi:hypothetical protein